MQPKPLNIGGRPPRYSLALRLKAKCLFLAGDTWTEISSSLGMDKAWLKSHARREGWSLLRMSHEQRTESLALVQKALKEWEQTISAETQQLSVAALPMIQDAIDKGSPRDLKDSAAGVKTLIDIARLSSGMDDKDRSSAAVNTPSLSMFFFNGPTERVGIEAAKPSMKLAEKVALDVTPEPEF